MSDKQWKLCQTNYLYFLSSISRIPHRVLLLAIHIRKSHYRTSLNANPARIFVFIQACSEIPTDLNESELESSITCQLGCVEVDPYPSSPGIFLGSGVTQDVCFDGQTDADADGLGDFCEKNLAEAFAPEMIYNNTDDIRRESYWAAKPNGTKVRVFYALAYYFDLGLTGFDYWECKAVSLWELIGECDGHHGDSEHVVLDLYYVPSTQHWLLDKAHLLDTKTPSQSAVLDLSHIRASLNIP